MNQIFVSIPLSRFKDKLIFKCKQHGIKVITISESYTSKASFYDNNKIDYLMSRGLTIPSRVLVKL